MTRETNILDMNLKLIKPIVFTDIITQVIIDGPGIDEMKFISFKNPRDNRQERKDN